MARRGKSLNEMRIQYDRIRDKVFSMAIERSNGRYPKFGTPVYNWAEEKKERLLDISNRYVHNLANSLAEFVKFQQVISYIIRKYLALSIWA